MTSDRWRRWDTGHRLLVTSHALLLAACNVTPLTNKIAVGEEAFVIAVGEGPDSMTDLFAAPAGGGAFARVTFNRAEEHTPRLAPDGLRVAYLRRGQDSSSWSVVILSLLSNAEQSAALPRGAGRPEGLGWSRNGKNVVVRARGYYAISAPPGAVALSSVDSAERPQADSATRELLGPGEEGMIRQCGAELCVAVRDSVTSLGPGVTGAVRWGADSVGYFSNGWFEVRPLRAGYARRPAWKGLPAHLRELSYHPGQVTTGSGVSGRR